MLNKIINLVDQMEFLLVQIRQEIDIIGREDLRRRGKVRLAKLLQEVTLQVDFDQECVSFIKETFPAGTLIQCDHTGRVYLDIDGDGYYNFPPHLLEFIELDEDKVPWCEVVCQG